MRGSALFSVLLALAPGGSTMATMSPIETRAIALSAQPLRLPDERRPGALILLAGWELRSDARQFGGLSTLAVEGDRFTALTDAGAVVRFRMGGTAHGASIAALPSGCGVAVSKMLRDTESLARDPATKLWWIGYEATNKICATDDRFGQAIGIARVPAMRRWPDTGGAETLVRLADGRFLVVAERDPQGRAVRPLLLIDRDPLLPGAVVTPLGYRPPKGYRPTDAAQLPDGRVIVLNRRFSLPALFTAKLVVIDLAQLARGRFVEGTLLADIAPPLPSDNYEGIAVTTVRGHSIVWLLSDDNFMPFQRTLLLKLALVSRPQEAHVNP